MKFLYAFINVFLLCYSAFAQDTLILKDGKEISSKILEVNVNDIKYKRSDNIDGPTYTVKKSEIFILKYANGTKDVVTQEAKTQTTETQAATAEDMYFKGQMDAARYYKKYRGAGTATLITTLAAGGIIALIPAIACSATKPKEKYLGFPNEGLKNNTAYYNGYANAARKKKAGRVWMNWGIGCAINVGVFFILYAH